MKKLRVTWVDMDPSDLSTELKVASTDVHVQARISLLGQTLVFQTPGETETVLVLPENRLVSAIQIEVTE